MKIKFLVLLSFVLLLCSCAPQYHVRSEAKIDTLNLCLRYSECYPDSLKAVFDEQAVNFITNFNKYEHAFYMSKSDDTTRSTLIMDMVNTIIIGKKHQQFAVAYTVIGIATYTFLLATGAPFWLIFYYFPYTTTDIRLKLSPDLTRSETSFKAPITNWALFRSNKSQIKHHKKEFFNFLGDQIDYIEEQYNLR
jgi:hypothetical protein